MYKRILVADGNFKADHIRQKNEVDDVWLSEGSGMIPKREEYFSFLAKAIEMQTGGNSTARISVSPHWKWDTSRLAVFDYLTPFVYFGGSIVVPPSSGYNCVRVDRPISVWH